MEQHIGWLSDEKYLSNNCCLKFAGGSDDDASRPIIGIANSFNDMVGGDNLVGEGVIDSFEMVDIVYTLEDELGIEIDAALVVADNFKNMDAIVDMIEGIIG